MTVFGGTAGRGVVFAKQVVVPEPGTWITGIALCLPTLLSRRRNGQA